MPHCAACGEDRAAADYSAAQLKKKDKRRCKACVETAALALPLPEAAEIAAAGAAEAGAVRTAVIVSGPSAATTVPAKPPAAGNTRQYSLTKQQVVEKLDAIPMFNIVNERDQMFGTAHAGETACVWYSDLAEAIKFLGDLRTHNPGVPLGLGVTPLGTAYALAEGWVQPEGGQELPLRLQPSRPVLASVADAMAAMVDMHGQDPLNPRSDKGPLNPRTGPFPLFCSDELQSSKMFPLFLNREDFAATWAASGRPEGSLPESVQVADLRVLVARMLAAGDEDLSTMCFIASQQSIDYVTRMQEHKAAKAAEAAAEADPRDEPPPLE